MKHIKFRSLTKAAALDHVGGALDRTVWSSDIIVVLKRLILDVPDGFKGTIVVEGWTSASHVSLSVTVDDVKMVS